MRLELQWDTWKVLRWPAVLESIEQCVQAQRCSVLLGPEPQILYASGFAVEAAQTARSVHEGAAPDLLDLGQ